MNGYIIQSGDFYWNGTTWCTNRKYAKVYPTQTGAKRAITVLGRQNDYWNYAVGITCVA